MRILLIEDDARIARDVTQHLQRAGCVVEHESDGEHGWFRGSEESFAAAVLSVDGQTIDVTPLEYRCLHHLVLHRDRHVSQAELTEQLWAQDFERDSNSVEVLIARLRRKLGRDLIVTKRGFGYRIRPE